MEQTINLRLRNDEIKGFSYSFSRSIIDRIKKLRKEGKMFELSEQNNEPHDFTIIAKNLICYIKEQVPHVEWYGPSLVQLDKGNNTDWVQKFEEMLSKSIFDIEDFLSTFETKKPFEPDYTNFTPAQGEFMTRKISDLEGEIKTITFTALKRSSIKYVWQLLDYVNEIKHTRGLGKTGISSLKRLFADVGLKTDKIHPELIKIASVASEVCSE